MLLLKSVADANVSSELCRLPPHYKFAQDRRARRYVLRMGRRSGFEHLLCYCGESGKEIVRHTDKEKDAVGLPRRHLAKAYSRGGRLIIHHNHPQSMSLSPVDIQHLVARQGLVEIFAHGHDHSWYWATSGRRRDSLDMVKHGEIAFVKAAKRLRRQGVLLRDEWMPHLFNLALDHSGIIKYKFGLSPTLSADLAQVAPRDSLELLDCVKQAIRKERQ